MRATATQIEEAKRLIDEYCIDEFGYDADFDNLKNVGVAFSTNEPYNWKTNQYGDTFDIQVDVDIITMTIKKKL